MARTRLVDLPDGRQICYDDVGDPAGMPVVFVHGTPDSRLGRHPDDSLATDAGVRLLAVDRPGFGGSTADAAATPRSFAADLASALDATDVESCIVLAWSAGSLWALGAAAGLGDRVAGVSIASGLVPREAYDDPTVLAAAPEARLALLDTAQELGPEDAAALIAPLLVPDPPSFELALEQIEASHDPLTNAEISAVAGASHQMAHAMVDSVRQGFAGLTRDIEVQMTAGMVDLADVRCPVTLWYGADDTSTPPTFGRWYRRQFSEATLHVVEGGGHALLLPRWQEILVELAGHTDGIREGE